MLNDGGTLGPDDDAALSSAALTRLSRLEFELRNAETLDEIATAVLDDLSALPHVCRLGLALTEGAGRRLRFVVAEDREPGVELPWSHIDAYDDVPLTRVARTGDVVEGPVDDIARRFPALAGHRERYGAEWVVSLPLPGVGSPIGGLIVFYDDPRAARAEGHRRLLHAAARRGADAVRRVRVTAGRGPDDPAPDEIIPGTGGRRAELSLESDPRAAGRARRFLREHLADWGVDGDAADGAQLCLSEIVTNAIMHARTTSELVVHLEADVLTVVVRDVGATARPGVPATYLPVPEDDDPLRVYGRGLTLVDAIADRWGSEQDAFGTTAWFALELAHLGGAPAQTG